jgi:hypothetical protein
MKPPLSTMMIRSMQYSNIQLTSPRSDVDRPQLSGRDSPLLRWAELRYLEQMSI